MSDIRPNHLENRAHLGFTVFRDALFGKIRKPIMQTYLHSKPEWQDALEGVAKA